MRLASPFLLSAATTASSSILLATATLEASLPDHRFRKELIFDTAFLPVNPAFISILNFMSSVAVIDFDELVAPHTYTVPTYPQVQISTIIRTEARFLLWGIYLTVMDMVKFIRFHDVLIMLYWNNDLVGQINIRAEQELKSPSTTVNVTRCDTDGSGKLGRANISRNIIIPSPLESLKAPLVSKSSNSIPTNDVSSLIPINNKMIPALSIPSQPPAHPRPHATLSSRLTISFVRVPGAKSLRRNDVFLTFYTAILHLAELPVHDKLITFDSKVSTGGSNVNMYNAGIGCLVTFHSHLSIHSQSFVNVIKVVLMIRGGVVRTVRLLRRWFMCRGI